MLRISILVLVLLASCAPAAIPPATSPASSDSVPAMQSVPQPGVDSSSQVVEPPKQLAMLPDTDALFLFANTIRPPLSTQSRVIALQAEDYRYGRLVEDTIRNSSEFMEIWKLSQSFLDGLKSGTIMRDLCTQRAAQILPQALKQQMDTFRSISDRRLLKQSRINESDAVFRMRLRSLEDEGFEAELYFIKEKTWKIDDIQWRSTGLYSVAGIEYNLYKPTLLDRVLINEGNED